MKLNCVAFKLQNSHEALFWKGLRYLLFVIEGFKKGITSTYFHFFFSLVPCPLLPCPFLLQTQVSRMQHQIFFTASAYTKYSCLENSHYCLIFCTSFVFCISVPTIPNSKLFCSHLPQFIFKYHISVFFALFVIKCFVLGDEMKQPSAALLDYVCMYGFSQWSNHFLQALTNAKKCFNLTHFFLFHI